MQANGGLVFKTDRDVRLIGVGFHLGEGMNTVRVNLFRLPCLEADENCAEEVASSAAETIALVQVDIWHTLTATI
ncbi:hypothetical protein PRIPAC_88248, partial [Pristionchus pacificus]|uniref:Uncharacterized protein n=1 Tax=Pristionchus pacificus TaxID=54126 RepID=A0A2A6CWV5_PRIPA